MIIQIFFVSLLLQFSLQLQSINSEKLEIFPLGPSGKSLLHFEFSFQEQIELNSIIFETNVWSRSVFDELLQNAKVRQMRISFSNGEINPFLLDSWPFDFEMGATGTRIFLNADADYSFAINVLSDMFSFERKTFLQNHLLIELPKKLQYEKGTLDEKFVFGHSPDDFLCVDNFERVRNLIACRGEKGISMLLDFNKMMKGEYVSLLGRLEYDESTQIVKYGIEIITVIDSNTKEEYLQTRNIEVCEKYKASKIISFQNPEQKEVIDLNERRDLYFYTIPFYKLQETTNINFKQIKVEKSIAQPVYSFENDIIYQIETMETPLTVIISEYLPYYFSPQLSRVASYLNYKQIASNFTIEAIENKQDSVKTIIMRFALSLPANSTFSLKIPIQKLMKSFENYPHDSARGHPLIGIPVVYFQSNATNYYAFENTPFLLMRIPEPDFSMPFNISTYTLVLLGYFYLMIFKIVMGKRNPHWSTQNKRSLIKRIIGFFKKEKTE